MQSHRIERTLIWQLTWVENVRPQVLRLRRVMDAAEGVLAAPQNLKPGIASNGIRHQKKKAERPVRLRQRYASGKGYMLRRR